MPIGRGNPFDEIEDLFDRVTRELEGIEGERWGAASSVAVDVADQGDVYVVTADLPGFEKDDIDVTVTDATLRIAAERETTSEVETDDYLRRERQRGSVNRSVRLPEPVDDGGVEAAYSNGVLTVTLPKRGGESGKQIEIE